MQFRKSLEFLKYIICSGGACNARPRRQPNNVPDCSYWTRCSVPTWPNPKTLSLLRLSSTRQLKRDEGKQTERDGSKIINCRKMHIQNL
jgi:hypothetical protein